MSVTESGALIRPQQSLLFSADLYHSLVSVDSQSFLVSTATVQLILGILYVGARNTTAREIGRALRLFNSTNVDHRAFVGSTQPNVKSAVVSTYNKIYVAPDFVFKDGFNQSVIEKGVESEYINFGNEELAREEINEWIRNKTNEKIRYFNPPGTLNNDTRILLVSASNFNDRWKYPFSRNETEARNFYISKNSSILVETLHGFKFLEYGRVTELNSTVLLLPYERERVSLFIILPDAIDGLPEVERKLTGDSLQNALNSVWETTVDVYLPKLNFADNKNLRLPLEKLGIVEAFKPDANFGGISETPLHLDFVQHSTFIELNEEGTNTDSGTGSNSQTYGRIRRAAADAPLFVNFNADHPFLYFILDPVTQDVYFAGRCKDPRPVNS